MTPGERPAVRENLAAHRAPQVTPSDRPPRGHLLEVLTSEQLAVCAIVGQGRPGKDGRDAPPHINGFLPISCRRRPRD